MKIILALLFVSVSAFAQTASVKDIPADQESETTISVSKGSKAKALFEVTSGTAEIEGDPEILTNAARKSWKAACDEWKKETKELNKENGSQVLAISCNSQTCSKNEGSATVCKSTGTYKIKTRIN